MEEVETVEWSVCKCPGSERKQCCRKELVVEL